MKKIILSILALLIVSNIKAQNGITIQYNGNGPDISGGTHSIDIYPSSPDLVAGILSVHFLVTNLTGSDQQWIITRKEMNVPVTWIDQLSWPTMCYSTVDGEYTTPQSASNPAPIIINGSSLTTNGLDAELNPRINPDQNASGSAHYRYYIVEASGGDRVDSVDLMINFVLGISAIKQTPLLSISPNPANEYVNISVGSAENTSIKIVDVLGNVVYIETISNDTKNIDISNFKNGVYFVLVETPGVKSINRKLIIRH